MLTTDCADLFPFREEGVTCLDHGGFGVSPTQILQGATRCQARINGAPRPFFDGDGRSLWSQYAARVAKRFSAQAGDVALVDNATDGINSVLRSFSFQPDDEVLLLSVCYGAIALATKAICAKQGARVTMAQIEFPGPSRDQAIDAVKKAITPRTKLAILDHITSGTALVMPVAEMTKACRGRGVPVLIDGAHAAGSINLDIPSLNADWYVGNLHKWYFVPRGCGFLWAKHERQARLLPTVLSWEIERSFPDSFSWTGTRDPSSWLSIPGAFDFMDRFGEENVRRHNHDLVLHGTRLLAAAWNVDLQTPDSLIGCMNLIPLPDDLLAPTTDQGRGEVGRNLWDNHKIIAPCILYRERLYMRVSAQIYNEPDDYVKLGQAIQAMRR